MRSKLARLRLRARDRHRPLGRDRRCPRDGEPSLPPSGGRGRHLDLPGAQRVDDGQCDRPPHPVPAGPSHRGPESRSRLGMDVVACTRPSLPKPITTDDGTFTSTVSEIDWSGGSIPGRPVQRVQCAGSRSAHGNGAAHLQGRPALQRRVHRVSWIQVPTKAAPDPEHPAPTLVLTAPGKGSPGPAPASPVSSPAAVTTGSPAPSSADNGLAIAALILAAFAVLAAILAIWLGRPRFSPASADPGRPPASSGSPPDGS